MQHVMLDIDGTLIQSYEFDEQCFMDAVLETTGIVLTNDWQNYPDVTDRGILRTLVQREAPGYTLEEMVDLVKPVFTRNIQQTLRNQSAQEIVGARNFVNHLLEHDQYLVSVATGGWGETALLKLKSAGFDTDRLSIASSNDHHARIEIMQIAKTRVDANRDLPITYFGDAAWDVAACQELGVNLVIVGNRADHHQRIPDFADLEKALSFVG